MRSPIASLALSALALTGLSSLSSAQAVYMSGLANPRGLTFAADGTLYVAEAGAGGGTGAPQFTGANGELQTFGFTGGVSSKLGNGAQTKVLSSLPSVAAGGSGATGPAAIGFTANGTLAVLYGLGGSPAQRATLGTNGALLGTLATYATASSAPTVLADYAARELSENPDGTTEINSNPYDLARSGSGFVVSDSGANALWRDGGSTVFPKNGATGQDSVPTGVVARPGGGFTVSSLGGAPFNLGQSRIFNVGANGGYTEALYGLTTITDLAYAPDGSLIVTEISATGLITPSAGDVKRIRPDGTVDLLIGGLITPTSLAFGPDGFLYVTNNALSGTDGQVLRYAYQPVPEPATVAALAVGALGLLRRRR